MAKWSLPASRTWDPPAENYHITFSLLLYIPDSGQEYLIFLIASALGMGPLHLDKGAHKQQQFCLLRLQVRFYML